MGEMGGVDNAREYCCWVPSSSVGKAGVVMRRLTGETRQIWWIVIG